MEVHKYYWKFKSVWHAVHDFGHALLSLIVFKQYCITNAWQWMKGSKKKKGKNINKQKQKLFYSEEDKKC